MTVVRRQLSLVRCKRKKTTNYEQLATDNSRKSNGK